MSNGKSYIEMDVWKKSRLLVSQVYDLTKNFPKEELYSLTNQMRRSAISVPSNIAEGIGRLSKNETNQFLNYAKGSLYELETQFFLSFDQSYITNDELTSILELITECKKLINGTINYYNSKN
jgi:four helix bundle protein